MSFAIEEREHDSVLIFALRGRLVAGAPVELFRERLLTFLADYQRTGRDAVILDCSSTDYIDSSGLGLLVVAHSRATAAGFRMPIFGLNRRGLELLVITKLSTVFELYNDEIDAVNSCFPGREVRHFDILDFVRLKKNEAEPT